jgi:outer membrane protein OmpA-like peptidoglycan-associated protein
VGPGTAQLCSQVCSGMRSAGAFGAVQLAPFRSLSTLLAICWGIACARQPPPFLPAALAPTGHPQENVPVHRELQGQSRVTVFIAPTICEACGIAAPVTAFAYDSAQRTRREERILDELARCLISGRLSGRTVTLVGHADRPGDQEFELMLSQQRTEALREALLKRGLDDRRVRASSRLPSAAIGTRRNEVRPRRVDVLLAD